MSKKATLAVAVAALAAATAPAAPEGDSPPDTPPDATLPDAVTGIETEERVAPETEHPDCVTQIAELTASLDEERRRVVELEAALIEARGELRDQRARFNAAWSEREAQIAQGAPTASPATPLRRPIADAMIPVVIRGARRVLKPGDEIPDEIDPATLPPGSVR